MNSNKKFQKEDVSDYFRNLQKNICTALENADGKEKFLIDKWERKGGGGGSSNVIQNGALIEKGGVNFSEVFGKMPDQLSEKMNYPNGKDFYATGVSIVIHPNNPHIPIIHMNVRYFEIDKDNSWFGGGIDLTPHYIIKEDARQFHQKLKVVCDNHHPSYYPEFKKWADNYFYVKHREETRGVGGIFFDKLSADKDFSIEDRFAFVKSVGESFVPIYTELLGRYKNHKFTDEEQKWQFLRRGRYVEFNLIYDAGTRFGLETDGRVESILMSLPYQANWQYNFQAKKGSKEEATLKLLKKDIDWINMN